ncbi:hypothetical protein [Burkholderia lata]|uniref:hypothetical protein n=1 Tax=Burkholderia lata (strain ATCC 17760 / DSM 23089 / LMG 22485 / NCIMB 9086 / R18194 / 383) TaxID=482957 RepID=UPI0015827B73|nr:hypothetical protein [Burkholderia lata]
MDTFPEVTSFTLYSENRGHLAHCDRTGGGTDRRSTRGVPPGTSNAMVPHRYVAGLGSDSGSRAAAACEAPITPM